MSGVVALTAWILTALVAGVGAYSSVRSVAPYVYSPVCVALGVWGGRLVGRQLPGRSLALTLVIASAWLVAGVLLIAEPGKMPIGYANANAALAVQFMALAGLLTLRRRAEPLAWAGVALAFSAIVANRSAAGTVVAVLLLTAISFARLRRPGAIRWPVVLMSIAVVASATSALTHLASQPTWPVIAGRALDETRRILWSQAWASFVDAAFIGNGPGSFASMNVLKDPDQSSAHSLPLQVAAELGLIGITLLALLYVVGLLLGLRACTPVATWIVITAWTALTLHSFVDHILEYWPVAVASGLVLGYGLVAETNAEAQHKVV